MTLERRAELAEMDYPQRLAAILADDPEAARTGILATGTCEVCAVPMSRRVNAALDDSYWSADDGSLRGGVAPFGLDSGWDVLDHLAATDVSEYSRTQAFHDIMGSWPWEHAHLVAR